MNTAEGNEFGQVRNLLEDIKKLLVLGLISRRVQGKDIARVLGVDKSTITRIVPTRKIKVSKTDEEI